VAARYIDDAYVRARVGNAYLTAALVASDGVELSALIEDATASIQTALRNSGYESLATDVDVTAGGTYSDAYVKMAVFGRVREKLAQLPQSAIPLPEDWANTDEKLALDAILSGDAQLASTPTQISAVGGAEFTESDPLVSDSVPQRSSRSELAGF